MRLLWPLLLVGCEEPVDDTGLLTGTCEADGPSVAAQRLVGGIDTDGRTGVLTSDAGWYLLADRLTDDGVEIATWFSSDEGATWTPSLPLALVDDRYVGNVSTVRFGGEQWVYFQTAAREVDPPVLWRSRFDGDRFGPVEAVRPLLSATSWASAPVLRSDGGAVWAAYRTDEGVPAIAAAADGVLFAEIDPPLQEPVESFLVGAFGDGTILAVWQRDDGPALLSQTVGEGWTTPRNVSSQFGQVDDVTALFVERGRVDLYYRASDGTIHRRPVYGAGGASPEEAVDIDLVGEVADPVAYRLPDCRVLLTVASEDQPMAALGVVILDGDASTL